MSTNSIAKREISRADLLVRFFTWLAVALFMIVFPLAPRGITVPWNMYLLGFGPIIIVDLASTIGFVVCRLKRRTISFAYLFMSLGVAVGVWYVTWFELRLRWFEVFQ
jgi:hypothetical protein